MKSSNSLAGFLACSFSVVGTEVVGVIGSFLSVCVVARVVVSRGDLSDRFGLMLLRFFSDDNEDEDPNVLLPSCPGEGLMGRGLIGPDALDCCWRMDSQDSFIIS